MTPATLPGEALQLYTGMRTVKCRLIDERTCTAVDDILIEFAQHTFSARVLINGRQRCTGVDKLNRFAWSDGFGDWRELRQFWEDRHPGITTFRGVVIRWEPRK